MLLQSFNGSSDIDFERVGASCFNDLAEIYDAEKIFMRDGGFTAGLSCFRYG